ncbi:MAG: hypothetical protein D6714_13725 [Bacteroidetes bacterium]|nr:MAG: hypothetical protein D6714_13725 [Bacteroidota bacterium]
MITERKNHDFETLMDAINCAREEGYSIEFVANEKGFFDPKNKNTYLPESICRLEVIRVDAPMSEPDAQSILYLIETVDGQKGWISDAYGTYANPNIVAHLEHV